MKRSIFLMGVLAAAIAAPGIALGYDYGDRVVVQSGTYAGQHGTVYIKSPASAPAKRDAVVLDGQTTLRLLSQSTLALEAAPTPTPSPTPTATPSPTPTATPTSTPAPGAPTLRAVDGGTGYYGSFPNSLPTSSSFFPIGVWGAYDQTQANMNLDAGAGLNTYVWASDSAFIPDIRADGRFNVIQDQSMRSSSGTETKGWLLGDEDDMSDTATCPNTLNSEKSGLDTRFKYANFGKGLAVPPDGDNWWADAAEQQCWTNGVDVDSVDLYWFTDPYNGPGNRFGYKYGENIANLRAADASDGRMHPHWGFVETGWPFSQTTAEGGRAILPAELRSAAWHQIIAGVRGLVYFEHSFGGPHAGDHHTIRTNSEGTRAMVTSVDAQIKQLAPVLNSPSVTSGWSTTGGVKAMVKWNGAHFYVFMGAMTGATTATFSMPCIGSATAVNQGETTGSLSIPVANGQFSDSFSDKNAVHIYEIDGGSSCGLS